MAVGWSITDRHIENFTEARKKKICEQRVNINSYEDYEKLIKKWKVYDGKSYVPATVRKLYWEVKPDDLVWIRYKGIYYLGRVGDTSQWVFDQDNLQKDAAIQRTDIEWLAVGDESTVPGFVATAFIKGKTLQRINSEAVQIFSQHYYNTKIGKEHYQGLTIEANPEKFYDLLSPTDCEDLVCAYLSYEYKYIVIPSTNKKSTELYECVLLDPEDRSHVYIQVKKGNVDIDANDFRHLQGKVFLFTSEGTVKNLDSNNENIKCISPEELFKFAMSDAATNIVSDSISYWTEYMRKALK
jgi:hypothetical protein